MQDDGTEPLSRRASLDGSMASGSRRSSLDGSVTSSLVRTAATKPSAVVKDRKRKRSSSESTIASAQPVLEAVRPDTQQVVKVVLRQRGRGRPPKDPASVPRPDLVLAPIREAADHRSSSIASSTTTLATAETPDESWESDILLPSSSDASNTTGRPKRLSAPTFLGESPQRVRQQSVRGKNPAKY